MKKFSERVTASTRCPYCLAKPGERCTLRRGDPSSGPSRDLYHDSRARVFEDGACGSVLDGITRVGVCVRHKGHDGRHDYGTRAR